MDIPWQSEIDTILSEYEESGNPLFIWEAFKICRDHGKEIPDWVFMYLENVASDLLSLSEREEMSDERASAEVYAALGMKQLGARDIFDRYSLIKETKM